jgi:aryl-alcohol dehydrogenase-like predicted oxidoreductase
MVANHPFGGAARVQQCRVILGALAKNPELDVSLREKLRGLEDGVLADVVLNAILRDTGIHVVIPSMMRVEHIRANVGAVTHSRFDSEEVAQIRRALASSAQ